MATKTSDGFVVAVGVTWGPEGVTIVVAEVQPDSIADSATMQASAVERRALFQKPESFWLIK